MAVDDLLDDPIAIDVILDRPLMDRCAVIRVLLEEGVGGGSVSRVAGGDARALGDQELADGEPDPPDPSGDERNMIRKS